MENKDQNPQAILVMKDNAQALLNYLAQRPYAEVQPFIAMIQSCQVVDIHQAPGPEQSKEQQPAPNRAARRQSLKKS